MRKGHFPARCVYWCLKGKAFNYVYMMQVRPSLFQATDVHSLAITSWEIVTACCPFEMELEKERAKQGVADTAHTTAELWRTVTTSNRPDLFVLPADVPLQLAIALRAGWGAGPVAGSAIEIARAAARALAMLAAEKEWHNVDAIVAEPLRLRIRELEAARGAAFAANLWERQTDPATHERYRDLPVSIAPAFIGLS